jgi:UDP-N-acetyl-D-glucosamine dehydrogenase
MGDPLPIQRRSAVESKSALHSLEERLDDRSAIVAIVGLGYVGLPLAGVFLQAGFRCIGFDVDLKKITELRAGRSYIKYVDGDWLKAAVEGGTFLPTTNPTRLSDADCIIICVPTPLTPSRDPDLRHVEETARTIASAMRPGQLISLESTTYPGTTRDVLVPILETSGLRSGVDFLVTYSPEREDPGNQRFATSQIPKVVGGLDERSLACGVMLYGHAVHKVVPVSTVEVAEACKILENTYRAVNIALVNELKILFDSMDIDVWDVIDAASTKPFGFQRFTPGPGLGGHCIPIDPFYLAWLARRQGMATRFIELAGEINHGMPKYVVEKLTTALNDAGKAVRGSKIGIIGLAYKPNIDDPRESPAFAIIERVQELGGEISYHDPHIPHAPKMRSFDVPSLDSEPLTSSYLSRLDAVVVVTDHESIDWQLIADSASLVVDTRNVMPHGRAKVVRA